MTTYGLTEEGLVIKTLPIIRAEGASRFQGRFGISLDMGDESVEGQLNGMIAEAAALLWELGQAINAARSADTATGAQLEGICLLTGTFRAQASFSAVTLTLSGLPTSPVPAGSLSEVDGTGKQFQTSEDATIVALTAWVALTGYVVGDRVTNAGNTYICRTSGTSAGSGGPTTKVDDITDGSAHWRFMGVGTGAVDVLAQATETGPTIAVSGTIKLVTSLGGWTGVINLLDATPGRNRMSDEELRVLRELELAKPGTSPADAIAADLLDVTGVTAVTVFVNNGDFTDADGVPPHSIECLIDGGEDQAIWDQLLASVAGGIRTHGTEVGTAIDVTGRPQTMKFSRAELIDIWVSVTLDKVANDPENDNSYPIEGDDDVALAIVTAGNLGGNGRNVVASAVQAPAFSITGVVDVTATLIGLVDPPVASTTIVITNRQRAVFDTSRVEVISSDGEF